DTNLDSVPTRRSSDLPKYKIRADAQQQTNIIFSLIEKATSIVHAGDPDDEGCLLVDEILDYAKNTKPVQRLLVADLNLAPVQKRSEEHTSELQSRYDI